MRWTLAFDGAESFNNDLSKWDVSKVRNLDHSEWCMWGIVNVNHGGCGRVEGAALVVLVVMLFISLDFGAL